MQERGFLEWVQRGDIYVKVGRYYRPVTDKRDGDGALIDIDYSVYTRDGNGRYTRLMPGPKGDVPLPAGAEGLLPPEESSVRQIGRSADYALGKMINWGGCAARGCMWYLLIGFVVSLIGGIIM